MDGLHNNQRRHSVIGMLSPIAYEQSQRARTSRITPVHFSGGTSHWETFATNSAT